MSELGGAIILRQLPEIEEHLAKVAESIERRTQEAMSMVVTEDTRAAVKSIRADLNREFKEMEQARTQLRSDIMEPYDQFMVVYTELVSSKYKAADENLKRKIEAVESQMKEEKAEEVKAYFTEKSAALLGGCDVSGYDFGFERSGINVTLTASMKSLKAQADSFLERVASDIRMIDGLPHSGEIMVEYERCLNAGQARQIVEDRHKRIDTERERQEHRSLIAEQQAAHDKAVSDIVKAAFAAPVMAPPIDAENERIAEQPIITLTFKATGTREQLIAVREFMKERGIRYA